MSQFALLGKRRFAPFFWTQALGAFNDSAFRNAMVMLAAFQMGLPDREVSLYTNLAPALFILPYFLFSATAGQLAEKFEKTRIIRYVKLFEIAAMLLAAWGFHTHNLVAAAGRAVHDGRALDRVRADQVRDPAAGAEARASWSAATAWSRWARSWRS